MRIRNARKPALALAVAILLPAAACRHSPNPPPAAGEATPAPSTKEAGSGKPVQAQMRNVDYHVLPSAVLNIDRLRGELRSTKPGKHRVFDEKGLVVHMPDFSKIGKTETGIAAR